MLVFALMFGIAFSIMLCCNLLIVGNQAVKQ